MPNLLKGVVAALTSERAGLQRVTVDLARPGHATPEPAYVLTDLTGPVAPGDEVIVNTTAVDLGLGTGGWHVVHANLSAPGWSQPGGGHVMKLRYTSLQADVGVAEEHAPDLPVGLAGMPVVACTLHSQMAVVVAAATAARPGVRVAYVMTDGGALPLALSDLAAAVVDRGLLAAGTITAGQAFGGDVEAVGVPSALALARNQGGADLVVVAMGPGVVGTDSPLGTSALEAAPVLDTAAALDGRPVLCVRASGVDGRARHRGVSHHSRTVLDLVRSAVHVPVPPALAGELGPWSSRHRVEPVDDVDVPSLLAAAGLEVTTMGRGPADDPLFFQAAAAAGTYAAGLVAS